MRSQDEISNGIEAIENRIDRDAEYMEEQHPLAPIVMSIHQGKRAALQTIEQSEHGEHWEMYDRLTNALREDIGVVEYAQVQAMINAHLWARDRLDSL